MSKACCSDMEVLSGLQDRQNRATGSTQAASTASILSSSAADTKKPKMLFNPELSASARKLARLLLEKLPSGFLAHAARTELDRIAILTGDGQAMFASVMNPPRQKPGQRPMPSIPMPSILPFYARSQSNQSLDLEAIMKPRMPLMTEVSSKFEAVTEDVEHEVDTTSTDEQFSHVLQVQNSGQEESGESELPGDVVRSFPPNAKPNSTKRDFQTMENDAAGELEGLQLQELVNGTKKIRSQTTIAALPVTRSPEEDIVPPKDAFVGITKKTPDDIDELSQPTRPINEQPVVYGRPIEAALQRDGDSDSDIPTIDTTLAFDDEDEDEDDEE